MIDLEVLAELPANLRVPDEVSLELLLDVELAPALPLRPEITLELEL